MILLLLFGGIFYYRLYIRNPSIMGHFEQQTFQSNYRVFKNAILHAHLHFQTHKTRGCKIDCWIKGSVGLDFNSFGYPISTRYSQQNLPFDPLISDMTNNNQDCAQIWQFLMGPLHHTINTQKSDYRATFHHPSKSCVYRSVKLSNSSIIYKSQQGKVQLLAPN